MVKKKGAAFVRHYNSLKGKAFLFYLLECLFPVNIVRFLIQEHHTVYGYVLDERKSIHGRLVFKGTEKVKVLVSQYKPEWIYCHSWLYLYI